MSPSSGNWVEGSLKSVRKWHMMLRMCFLIIRSSSLSTWPLKMGISPVPPAVRSLLLSLGFEQSRTTNR